MLETIVGGIVLGILGAMAFVAYYHPKQYNYVMFIVIGLTVVLLASSWLLDRYEKRVIEDLQALSDLTRAQKDAVMGIIKARPENARLYNLAFWAFYCYAAFLWIMPLIGLSANQRELPNNRSRNS